MESSVIPMKKSNHPKAFIMENGPIISFMAKDNFSLKTAHTTLELSWKAQPMDKDDTVTIMAAFTKDKSK